MPKVVYSKTLTPAGWDTTITRDVVRAEVEELKDGLSITPGKLHGAAILTYNDHRMAMSFAIAGLAVKGIKIENPGCVGKTFPDFFEQLKRLAL